MYLAFDTETTSLPRADLHLAHPAQPHLLQFAGILFSKSGVEVDRLTTLVIPGPGATLATPAYRAHGISLERATQEGADPKQVFAWFLRAVDECEMLVGHNIQFDLNVMRILSARLLGQDWHNSKPICCTMQLAAPVIGLPPTPRMLLSGRNGPKPPTLTECMKHLFGESLIGAHDAMNDVRACIRVFQTLKSATRIC